MNHLLPQPVFTTHDPGAGLAEPDELDAAYGRRPSSTSPAGGPAGPPGPRT